MSDRPNFMICNPDEPGWFHGPSMSANATAPWCPHRVMVSPAGVSLLMTTPGLVTCCWYCIPADLDQAEFRVPPEIRAYYKETTGEELGGDLIAKLQRLALIQARRNRR